ATDERAPGRSHRPRGGYRGTPSPSKSGPVYTARLIRSRHASAAARGSSAYMIAPATATRHEAGSPVYDALTVASTSPPWRPTPGNRNGIVGNFARTVAASSGAVAPLTSPVFPS